MSNNPLITLKPGADGPEGPQGPQGPAGEDGADSTVPGPAGADGNTVLYGVIPPTTEGVDGDFYIDTATNMIYGPKAAGAWPAGTSLVGPQGTAGSDGIDGATGPAGADGADGADSTVPGPEGPQGPVGADGAVGAAGPAGADGADAILEVNTAFLPPLNMAANTIYETINSTFTAATGAGGVWIVDINIDYNGPANIHHQYKGAVVMSTVSWNNSGTEAWYPVNMNAHNGNAFAAEIAFGLNASTNAIQQIKFRPSVALNILGDTYFRGYRIA